MFAARAAVPDWISPPPTPDFGAERALIHISTDKPYYKPNEFVYIEAFLIDSLTKKPLRASNDGIYSGVAYSNSLLDPYSYLDLYCDAVILDSFEQEVHRYKNEKLYNGTVVFQNWKVP